MTKETVGDRIKRIRTEKKLSQRYVTRRSVGVSDAYLSRIESNDRVASLRAIREIAKALDVNAVYLETGKLDFCPHCGRPFEEV